MVFFYGGIFIDWYDGCVLIVWGREMNVEDFDWDDVVLEIGCFLVEDV